MNRNKLSLLIVLLCFSIELVPLSAAEFSQDWKNSKDRRWVGPDFWANRLQDWQVANGRLECSQTGWNNPMRSLHILTHSLNDKPEEFSLSVNLGLIDDPAAVAKNMSAGFLIGGTPDLDYRAAALLHHSAGKNGGLYCGIDVAGNLFINDFSVSPKNVKQKGYAGKVLKQVKSKLQSQTELSLKFKPIDINYEVEMTAKYPGEPISRPVLKFIVAASRLRGTIALISNSGSKGKGNFWFNDLIISGRKIDQHRDRSCGPVIGTQYTVSRGVLKMTAQMMPIGKSDRQIAVLEINENESWKPRTKAIIDPISYTAAFKVENWSHARADYRVVYRFEDKTYYYNGTIQAEPKGEVTVAAYTGNHNVKRWGVDKGQFDWTTDNVWFPHGDLVAHTKKHKPDLLFFSGDQIYEGASPTRAEKKINSNLDYLYKWYLFLWAWGDITRDIPTVTIPDDHDVFQGNLWGAGGRKAKKDTNGGYVMPAEFVKMVERTQTSHLPDTKGKPIKQGITTYFTSLLYGGVDFAVIEDRKFKTGFTSPNKNERLKMLGDQQLNFLRGWSADWRGEVWMKSVLSQTIFQTLNTAPKKPQKTSGGRALVQPGDYPLDKFVVDKDTNGWPQVGRNKALREIRKGYAVHIAGDQHLGSTIHYGVDEWNDAGYAICVPSIANFWPRRWFPPEAGGNRKPGLPKYTGEHKDYFGNLVTVYAVSNPFITGIEPTNVHDRAPGYGIIKFKKADRTIEFANWPRYVDPSRPDAKPYEGWPVVVNQEDNYGRKAKAWLPTISVKGLTDPVVQVVNEQTKQIVYTLRIKGTEFSPKVFAVGNYTLNVGEQGTSKWESFKGIKASNPKPAKKMLVKF